MFRNLLLLAALASLPLAGAAQVAQTYLGGSLNLLADAPFRNDSSPTLYGAALTLGRQFTPRLALQTGLSYDGRTKTTTFSNQSLASTELRTRVLTVPLLARVTFTSPESAFHADALAGFTYYHSTSRYASNYSYGNGSRTSEGSVNHFTAVLGPGLRYSLTPHLDLTAAALVNAVLDLDYVTSFNKRLFLNAQAGVQYTFD